MPRSWQTWNCQIGASLVDRLASCATRWPRVARHKIRSRLARYHQAHELPRAGPGGDAGGQAGALRDERRSAQAPRRAGARVAFPYPTAANLWPCTDTIPGRFRLWWQGSPQVVARPANCRLACGGGTRATRPRTRCRCLAQSRARGSVRQPEEKYPNGVAGSKRGSTPHSSRGGKQ